MWLVTGNLLTVWWRMLSLGLRLQQPLAFRLWLLKNCLSASQLGTAKENMTLKDELPMLLGAQYATGEE